MKMLPIVGCGASRMAVTLHQKPNLAGLKDSARNSSAESARNSRLSLRNANPSIYLIGKAECCTNLGELMPLYDHSLCLVKGFFYYLNNGNLYSTNSFNRFPWSLFLL